MAWYLIKHRDFTLPYHLCLDLPQRDMLRDPIFLSHLVSWTVQMLLGSHTNNNVAAIGGGVKSSGP